MGIKGNGHYLTLAHGQSDFKVKTCFHQKLSSHLNSNFIESSCEQGNETFFKCAYSHDQDGHHFDIW